MGLDLAPHISIPWKSTKDSCIRERTISRLDNLESNIRGTTQVLRRSLLPRGSSGRSSRQLLVGQAMLARTERQQREQWMMVDVT